MLETCSIYTWKLGRRGHNGCWASKLKALDTQRKQHLVYSSSSSTITSTTSNNSSSSDTIAPPIQVSVTGSAGRGVFATRRIGSGDLIHSASPVVSHPTSLISHPTTCYFCLKSNISSLTTFQLGSFFFCSLECRDQAKEFSEVEMKADWSAYNEYCRIQGLKYPLLVKRLACMVISGVASADSIDILQPATLSPHMILEMEEEFILLRSAFTKAKISDENMAFLTKKWYINVLARIRINAFRIELVTGGSYEDLFKSAASSVESEIAVGNAIYMLPSFYNHDCDPNTHIIWIDNVNARMKALREIQPGEELRICYLDASMDHDARQNILSQGFGFKCLCNRCLSGD